MTDAELNLLILCLCLASFVLGRMSRRPKTPTVESLVSDWAEATEGAEEFAAVLSNWNPVLQYTEHISELDIKEFEISAGDTVTAEENGNHCKVWINGKLVKEWDREEAGEETTDDQHSKGTFMG